MSASRSTASVDSLGECSFAVFTIPAAQELLEREGQYDAISVAADEGVSEDELVAAIAPVLPESAEVVSATAEAEEQVDEVSEFTSIFRYFLLAFGAIALFVGAFVIFNTFSITVAQRTREFATLRTIGASRRQVLGSVILESLVIGLLASLVGLGLGVVLAEGIEALFGSLGVDLPSGGSRVRDEDGRRRARRRRRHHARWPDCSPRFERRACPRSQRCAKVRRFRSRRFAPYVPWIAGLVVVGALARAGSGDVHRRAGNG